MNLALQLLNDQRNQMNLARYGVPQALTSLVLTPRFQASSHTVYLVMGMDSPDPLLVVKIPRLAGVSPSIRREARNLSLIQQASLFQAGRNLGADTTPRLVAHQTYASREILVETALVGRAMDPATVRQSPDRCCELTLGWLLDVAQVTRRESQAAGLASAGHNWFDRLVKQPLDEIAGALAGDNKAKNDLITPTWKHVAGLESADLPLVFEHGDLSHPNILLLKSGGIGVVDWEQAEPEGLPAADLFFFLAYAAFARQQARTPADYGQAFQAAFFGRDAWAVPYIRTYAAALGLSGAVLAPLFLLTWPRYLAALLARLTTQSAGEGEGQKQGAWLRANRYHALWQFTLNHFNELSF